MVRSKGGRTTRADLLVKRALFQYPARRLQEALQIDTSTDESIDSDTSLGVNLLPSSPNVHTQFDNGLEKNHDPENLMNDNFQENIATLDSTEVEMGNNVHPLPSKNSLIDVHHPTNSLGISFEEPLMEIVECNPMQIRSIPADIIVTPDHSVNGSTEESIFTILNDLPQTYEVELTVDVSTSSTALGETLNTVTTVEENMELPPELDSVTTPEGHEEGVVGTSGQRKKNPTPKKIKRKKLRAAGKEYTTRKGKTVLAKNLRVACTDKCPKKCSSNFSSEDREILFDGYWKLDPLQKKDFVLKYVRKQEKDRTTVPGPSRRQFSRKYFLPKNDDTIQVCRKFFQATLDITSKFLRYTEKDLSVLHCAKKDQRGCNAPKNKTPPRSLQHLRQFIESLPAVDSHYCRNSSERKYLPESVENLTSIYRKYKEYCNSMKFIPVSDYIFRRTFTTEYNIGIHVPKKDKCGVCVRYAALLNPTPDEQARKMVHDTEKNAINTVYSECQERSKGDSSFLTTSFDMEKVLSTPHGKSILFYYARKYAVYNLTFYESYTRNVYCYIWGECDAKRGCVEICSIMEKYLQEIDTRGTVKELALFCDNCAGQQKNIAMIAVLTHFIKTSINVKKISLNFLMAGHSLMTVDSVHALIEKATEKKTVYAPSEWMTIINNARYEPFPYNVIKLTHLDFRNWKIIGEKISINIEDGTAFRISEVRRAIFDKILIKNMQFKIITNATNPTEIIASIKQKRNSQFKEPPPKYCNPLPISMKKYRDLVDLCCTKYAIPEHYHHEYLNLPHSTTVRDALPEPDMEEEVDT